MAIDYNAEIKKLQENLREQRRSTQDNKYKYKINMALRFFNMYFDVQTKPEKNTTCEILEVNEQHILFFFIKYMVGPIKQMFYATVYCVELNLETLEQKEAAYYYVSVEALAKKPPEEEISDIRQEVIDKYVKS